MKKRVYFERRRVVDCSVGQPLDPCHIAISIG